ncbi:MlaD family protein [Paraburkholderia bonniea]|uniref:MlaD family protein n=1 Tax=Paraburkholderia bonniea TaxID=2152891 RepID=UPI0012911879|nr:MlaD family protein [Paraburkholderia bonniea]WJF90069.1 MlaD family protein [Paraburkholderia bonniea]WJF93383.1 MlaD family protein [Paraburkholderia bonniea]
MENKAHAFWAGLFTVLLAGAIAVAAFLFNVDRAVRMPYDLIARTNVTGLSTGASVRYRGLSVGKVQSIRFDSEHPGQIVIRIMVDKTTPVTQTTYGSLGFQGVTGIAFVQLDDSARDSPRLLSTNKQVAQLPLRPGLLDQLQKRGDVLLSKLEKVATDADRMLAEDTRQQLLATAASLQHAADGVATLTRQLSPAAGQLPATLNQLDHTLATTSQFVADLNRPDGPFTVNLNKVGAAAERAGVALTSMDTTLQELSAQVGYESLPRINRMAEEVRTAARSVNRAGDTFSSNPRSVLFGVPRATPGPGEPGFAWPAGTPASQQAAP